MKPHSQHIVDNLEAQLKAGNIPECAKGAVVAVIDQCRLHQRQDRSALLRMAGDVASGLVQRHTTETAGTVSRTRPQELTDEVQADIAKMSVTIARAILEEVDRGE